MALVMVKVAAMINDENGKILGIGDKNHYRDCGVRPPSKCSGYAELLVQRLNLNGNQF
ncbi:hypothetical protein O9993_05730 [Vibrio lentus]|nr:hypothetical protein [Vibrio lentus]